MDFEITPLSNGFGAEVTGLDLSQTLSYDDFETVRRVWFEAGVVVFRDQILTPEHQVAFSRRFGPLIIHVLDQFQQPGQPEILLISNKKREDGTAVGFEEAGRWFDMKRVAVVGFPVRREVLQLDRSAGRRQLEIPADRFVVFVFGGSQGSRVINRALVEALPILMSHSEQIVVLHATGRTQTADYDAVLDTERRLEEAGIDESSTDWYQRCEYLEQIEHAYAAADLVVCRGGMSTLTEVGVSAIPSIIIPLSTSAEDHQAINAREIERRGAASVLYEEACWMESGEVGTRVSGRRLADAIVEYVNDPEKAKAVGAAAGVIPRRDSLECIVDELQGLVQGRRPAPLKLEFPSPQTNLPTDPNRFLRHVRDRLDQVDHRIEALPDHDLAYLRYQADRHLASSAWYEIPLGRRNVGVKLVGWLRYTDRLDLVLEILRNRRSAGKEK